ncbi:LPS export ABC transporter protein LptC [Filimonas lacunae]|uniref:LPS export ABC transporter protein LptC n=1 Tax=Filimonas lacunae TaxID=477680 RepID=A0A173MQV7_9BACT|nr:LPS export ABC transporter periplasmic protein LptC [Filimonas lacunae]BAV09830.1 hypothetical protein FLA_5883 [Filimonas lacunae]SIS79598.1 LPS export ABC transporter protein LptC [Filimonas lacunae]
MSRLIHKPLLPVLLAMAVLVGCENNLQEVRALGQKKTGVEEGKQIESYLSQDSKTKARLKAPIMLRYLTDTTRIVFPNTLHVDFFTDSLKVESILFAKYGTYLERDRKVLLKDSVIVINILKHDTLRTEELWWDQNRQKFYTDKPVSILQPEQRLFGQFGMEADQNFKDWTLFQASGRLKVEDSTLAGP